MILYFSGTGNSAFVAKQLADALNDTAVNTAEFLREGKRLRFSQPGPYVFVAPVYVAAPPLPFLDFLRGCVFPKGEQAYFVMTCAATYSGCHQFWERFAARKRFHYMGAAKVVMPQNYVIYFRSWTDEKNRESLRAALPEIARCAELIRMGAPFPERERSSGTYLASRLIVKPYYRLFIHAKAFRATEKCIGCGKCASVCPLGNISMKDGRPLWGDRCTHCMGCINLCPTEAVEYGARTRGKLRYHGPGHYRTAGGGF